MSARHLLLLLLLVFNALAFIVARSGMGGPPSAGEAERLAQQLNRERIRLVSELPAALAPAVPASAAAPAAVAPALPATPSAVPQAVAPPAGPALAPEPKPTAGASASASAAPVGCIAWKDLPPALAATLSARLKALRVTATRSEAAVKWWVRIPSQGSREQAERVVTRLRAQGVSDSFIVPATAPTPFAISLGLFKSEKAAQQLLAQLESKGVRNAGIEVRTNPGASRIEARLRADQAGALERLHPALAPHRTDCAS